jgi:DNA-binding Lrp family transcriptional regulator
MRGFMMISTDAGADVPRLAAGLRAVPEVVRVGRVTGPFDLFCTVEADDLLELEKAAAWRIRSLDGIARTSMHIAHPAA